MIAVDTSVVVAAFASWHEAHEGAADMVAERPGLPAPCVLETYAVLTRLPPPHRAAGGIVRDFLARAFPAGALSFPPEGAVKLIEELVDLGITGGASYDAVVAMTTRHHGHELATLDLRARATYERVGVPVRYLGA